LFNKSGFIMKRVAVALLAAVSALSVWSQQPKQEPKIVGKSVNVTGLVSVVNGLQMTTVAENMPLIVDTQILTSSTGGVTLEFDNGCDVTLKENESIKVSDARECTVLWALVKPVGSPLGVVAAGAGGTMVPAFFLVAGGAAAAAAAIVNNRDKTKASGS
jgi:hypothetical protein